MNRSTGTRLFILLAIQGAVPWAVATDDVDFAKQVLPILSDKCFVCHGPDAVDEDFLRLDLPESATSVRDGARAIDRDNLENSQVLKRIHSTDDPMPPLDAEKQLSSVERKIISQWVKQGGKYSKHWAFETPKRHPVEAAEGVDFFIERKMKNANLSLAAEKSVLARRVSLVLTGLPPEPDRLKQFIADESPAAYEKYIDELLVSPRYGEHQARYWLDAVRYGDTHGLHLDNKRGIYPYRDWVVKAFNDNLPPKDFITWQLAGDLLEKPTPEQLVATGYVRLNPSTGEGGAIPAEFQMKNNFDRVETLGTVFLGLSLTCARCHNHKYDPITQKEYYQLLAFFNNTAEPAMDRNKYDYGPVVKVPQNQSGWEQWRKVEQQKQILVEAANRQLDQFTEAAKTNWKKATDTDSRLQQITKSKTGVPSEIQKAAAEVVKKSAEIQKTFTTSLIAKELAKPRETHVLKRGEYDQPLGDPVIPGVPAALETPLQTVEGKRPTRLELATWLTDGKNPLVYRVIANRIFQRVFGYGLVRTPEDFGLQGEQPTHPELLDWLAFQLRTKGFKSVLKLMVTSKTFMQSSRSRTDVADPENRQFARFTSYRLDAEVLRDIGLWSSQLLDPAMGGEGVKPYQPAGMWKALAHPGSNTKSYQRDSGNKLYRRSLYVYWKRTSPHPMMTLFDAPDRESSCVRRSRTNTSLQSLGLLNETQRIEMSRKLAERVLKEAKTDQQRIDRLFTLLASRPANDAEQSALKQLISKLMTRYESSPADGRELLSVGEAKIDESLNTVELATWTQVAVTVLASDAAIVLY